MCAWAASEILCEGCEGKIHGYRNDYGQVVFIDEDGESACPAYDEYVTHSPVDQSE